jgi:hypothetical protein
VRRGRRGATAAPAARASPSAACCGSATRQRAPLEDAPREQCDGAMTPPPDTRSCGTTTPPTWRERPSPWMRTPRLDTHHTRAASCDTPHLAAAHEPLDAQRALVERRERLEDLPPQADRQLPRDRACGDTARGRVWVVDGGMMRVRRRRNQDAMWTREMTREMGACDDARAYLCVLCVTARGSLRTTHAMASHPSPCLSVGDIYIYIRTRRTERLVVRRSASASSRNGHV